MVSRERERVAGTDETDDSESFPDEDCAASAGRGLSKDSEETDAEEEETAVGISEGEDAAEAEDDEDDTGLGSTGTLLRAVWMGVGVDGMSSAG